MTVSAIPFWNFGQSNPPRVKELAYTYDGLTAFTPFWALAAIFSIAGDTHGLIGYKGSAYMALSWAVVLFSLLLLLYPRRTGFLLALVALSLALYALRLPVASNNKTIATVMNGAILLSAAVLYVKAGGRGSIDRVALYDQIRVVARALLAIMYFYGIFHKINTDFLDPAVSCAVGLYVPLARPFGLEDNLFGRYLAIYSTFVIEAIAIVSLYWKRYFAVGFILALIFHYIIPISAYSWYMDFSSLVFALYVLSIPTPASKMLYGISLGVANALRENFGRIGTLIPGVSLLLTAGAVVMILTLAFPERSFDMIVHSIWVLVWAVAGGAAMVVLTYVALWNLPCENVSPPRQPAWIYAVPGLFFISCLSPYVGLKTESSINMFSNLHTEAGQTNHLLFSKPPYLFNYQNEVVKVVDASDPHWVRQSQAGNFHILHDLKRQLRWNPQAWVTYVQEGATVTRATAASLAAEMPNILERKLLIFKLVDFSRPKVCTH
ncbi:thiol-disulfide oxidoreductase [Sinorhizobium sp. 8-89]|uniref:thiol-disulfide oxidoreductase n=1 Tax=Sinorhizobium sp. 7-81 TaxID=3049087 RepID=UPI0024C401DA|nr:thiol-disulfide oxidoreductase [Sinorhizobium sp. 7-81]MDK1387889.1 thiol-disulfide oxidoreductase [Sinorhizobium sp. 7-81]